MDKYEKAYQAMEQVRPLHAFEAGEDEFTEMVHFLYQALERMSGFTIDEQWWKLYDIYKNELEQLRLNPGTPELGDLIEERVKLHEEGKLPPDPEQWFPSEGHW